MFDTNISKGISKTVGAHEEKSNLSSKKFYNSHKKVFRIDEAKTQQSQNQERVGLELTLSFNR